MVTVAQHTDRIRAHLLEDAPTRLPADIRSLLQEQLVQSFVRHRLVESAADEDLVAWWLQHAWTIIHTFACSPFTSQQQILDRTGLTAAELTQLNAVLRADDDVQDMILTYGLGAKYWQNTIVPLIQSGAIDAARQETYRYPFRIGIYPGPMCMFYCTFCGRNYEAKYDHASVPTGNAMFKSIFRDAPNDDPYTFYIAGGLEPLSNPGIGEIVQCAAHNGFNISMYTNGFMLTPQLLSKQPGLWDLDTLRISFYGVDQQTTFEVTQRADAFDRVVHNAKTFLKLRNARHSPMKFGFNHVILPGHGERVLQLAEIIAEVNRDAGSGRQMDFLTLRENYSVAEPDAIPPQERARMVDMFAQLEERRKQDDLCDLQIDYGYALHAITRGKIGRSLEMVDVGAMRPRAYPQVSVVIDLLGDVYAYREAGFLDRPGARRYIIGRVGETRSLETVVREFLASDRQFEAMPHDTGYFDIFDHVVTKLLNQADADEACGIPFSEGPVRYRVYAADHMGGDGLTVAHPTLAHPTLAHPTLATTQALAR